ncbi:MAG: DUF1838 family protein [Gammaproteobacteria bacterium]
MRSTRRTALGAMAAALACLPGVSPAKSKSAPRRIPLDLATPAGNVTAYLKLRASLDSRDVFMWFTGRLDLIVPGEPVRPIIDVESLILRRTEQLGPMMWNVTDWEAALYRPLGESRYLEPGESIRNPYTGRDVTPHHYVEGPVRFRFTEREPRIVGSRDILPDTGKPFSYPWRVVNDELWMTKSSYIRAPNWLSPEEFPEESSGKEVIVATHSSLRGALAEVEDPSVTTVRSDFAYTATSGWLPWMKMCGLPGMVSWAESGKKLLSLEEAPAAQLEALRRIHPQWFARPEPWPEFTNMYLQYKARAKAKAPTS